MSRAKPISWYLQCFSKELEKLIAEGMAGVAEVYYSVDLSREGLGKGLIGFVLVEFTEVESSGGELVSKVQDERQTCCTL